MTEPKRMRPMMTAGYGIEKKEAGMLDWAWVDAQMEKSRNYWITSTNADGSPHAAPVWAVWVEGALYFGTDSKSRKGKNLARDPRVVVHLESGDDVVIIEGVMEKVTPETALKEKIKTVYAAKYSVTPDLSAEVDNAWLTLKPKTALAWIEKDFPKTATRFVFE